jgi:hypothetical protein
MVLMSVISCKKGWLKKVGSNADNLLERSSTVSNLMNDIY